MAPSAPVSESANASTESEYENDQYTVGWISALSHERLAAELMLDCVHGQPQQQHKNDNNVYRLGQIGNHKVVIAVLPEGDYGTHQAAIVASQMQMSFTNLRFGLLVGIGGGIPGVGQDIRLGDVVVSKPEGKTGGVIQYDRGKQEVGGFKRTGHLDKPPAVLRNAVGSLKATVRIYNLYTQTILKHQPFNKAMESIPEELRPSFHPQDPDVLYDPTYSHQGKSGSECPDCDSARQLQRNRRSNQNPVVHYGIIASGNTLVKDASFRERLRSELGAMCAETEAAGLMNDFPCLVIRGICDYCDSHKNDRWQQYAALTAASYARELLLEIKAANVECLARIEISQKTIEASKGTIETLVTHSLRSLSGWFSPPSPSSSTLRGTSASREASSATQDHTQTTSIDGQGVRAAETLSGPHDPCPTGSQPEASRGQNIPRLRHEVRDINLAKGVQTKTLQRGLTTSNKSSSMFGNQFRKGFGPLKPVQELSSTSPSFQSEGDSSDNNEEASLMDSIHTGEFSGCSLEDSVTDVAESDACCSDTLSVGVESSQAKIPSVDTEVQNIYTGSSPATEYYRQSLADSPHPPPADSQPILDNVAPINGIRGQPVGLHPEAPPARTELMEGRQGVSYIRCQNVLLTPPQTPHEADPSFATQTKGSEAGKSPFQPIILPQTPPESPIFQNQTPLLDLSSTDPLEDRLPKLDTGSSADIRETNRHLGGLPDTVFKRHESSTPDPPCQPTITRRGNAMTMALQIVNFRNFNVEEDVEEGARGFTTNGDNELSTDIRPYNDVASKLQLEDEITRLRISEVQYTLTNERSQSTFTCRVCSKSVKPGILLICKNSRCQDLTVCNTENCINSALNNCKVGGHQFLAHYLCPKIQHGLPIQETGVSANDFPVKNARTTTELWLSSSNTSDIVMLAYCDSSIRLRTFYGMDCEVTGTEDHIQYSIQAKKLWPEEAQKVDMELLSIPKPPSCVPKLSSETIERCNTEGRKVVFTRLDCRLSSQKSSGHHQQYDGLWIGDHLPIRNKDHSGVFYLFRQLDATRLQIHRLSGTGPTSRAMPLISLTCPKPLELYQKGQDVLAAKIKMRDASSGKSFLERVEMRLISFSRIQIGVYTFVRFDLDSMS